MSSPLFTEVQEDFYRAHCREMSYTDQAKLMKEQFGLEVTARQLKLWRSNHHFFGKPGRGRFTKGQKCWNKSLPWDEWMPKESQENSREAGFKKGMKPANYRSVGSERINADGYIEIKIEDPSKWVAKHRLVWQEAHGEIPDGMKIVFLDQNKLNCKLDNLAMVDSKLMGDINRIGLSKDPEYNKTVIKLAELNERIRELQ